MQTWIHLVRVYTNAMTTIEDALNASGHPPLNHYDVLFELEKAGENGLRQYELEAALLLKQYSVSRLVERIEKGGYLRREKSLEDGRGKRLVITDLGRQLRGEMWQTYGPQIESLFGQKMSEGQHIDLARMLRQLNQD